MLKIFPKLSETFIASELIELRRRGVELLVLSLLPPRESLRHPAITRNGLESLVHYESSEFGRLARAFRPELIHAHFATESTAVARQLASELGVPFSFTAHGYDIHRKPPADFLQRASAARAVVTVSQANAEFISQHFGVPETQLRVIPCGINLEQFHPASKPERNVPPLILCVARLVPVKNLGLLLRACALLKERGSSYRCVIVGEGPQRGDLEQMKAQLGLETEVGLPGAATQDQVVGWWQRADLGVLTSEQEGMPVSLMEAAGCGVPVVATAVGGVPELVEHNLTGLLVPPNDPGSLAHALAALLSDGDHRARLGAAARRRAEERFSSTRQVERLMKVWSEILDAAG